MQRLRGDLERKDRQRKEGGKEGKQGRQMGREDLGLHQSVYVPCSTPTQRSGPMILFVDWLALHFLRGRW